MSSARRIVAFDWLTADEYFAGSAYEILIVQGNSRESTGRSPSG